MRPFLCTVYLCFVFGLTSNVHSAVYHRRDFDLTMPEHTDQDCDEAEPEKGCSLKSGDDESSYRELTPDQGWIKRSCPKGTLFSIEECGCSVLLLKEGTQDSSSSSSEEDVNCEETPVPCTRKASDNSKTYLQFAEGKGWIEQPCAKGTAYSDEDCACTISLPQSDISDSSSEEDCETPEPVPCSRKSSDNSESYYQFIEGKGWKKQPCPKGTGYNSADCACTISIPHEDSSSSSSSEEDEGCEESEPVPCTRKPSNNYKSYLQFVEGKGWVEQDCAKGTAYNDQDCACSVTLPHEDVSDSSSSSEEDCAQPEDIPCTRKPSHDSHYYLQYIEGKGWSKQSCAKGTLYSERDCSCSISLPHEDISDSSSSSSSSSEEDCEQPEDIPCTRKPSEDSHYYLQYIEGKGWSEQPCAKGTLYSDKDCSCSISLPQEDISDSSSSNSEEDCEQPEDIPCTRKPSDDSHYYLQHIEGKGWIEQSCAKGTLYSDKDCSCSISLPREDISDSSSSSSSSEEDCAQPEDIPCTRKPSDDSHYYLQYIEGKGWSEQPCAKGTLYSDKDCSCSISLPQEDISDSSSSSSEEEENCENPEPVPCTRKPDSDIKFYLQMIEGKGYVKQACAKGTAYNDEDCSCTISLSSEDISSSSEESCEEAEPEDTYLPCTLEAGDDQTSFLQYTEGNGWIVQRCPDGTAFSTDDCGCTVTLPTEQKRDNKKISYGSYKKPLGVYGGGESIYGGYGENNLHISYGGN